MDEDEKKKKDRLFAVTLFCLLGIHAWEDWRVLFPRTAKEVRGRDPISGYRNCKFCSKSQFKLLFWNGTYYQELPSK
jgi:hypothetical protein